MNVLLAPPLTSAPAVLTPVAGFIHSTAKPAADVREVHGEVAAGRSIDQEFRIGRAGAGEGMTGRGQLPLRSHGGQVHAIGVITDVAHGVTHVLPARIRPRTDPVHRRRAEIAPLARIIDDIGVHEQRLIPVGEVDPEVIAIDLRGVVPDAEVTVVRIVDVHLATPDDRCRRWWSGRSSRRERSSRRRC